MLGPSNLPSGVTSSFLFRVSWRKNFRKMQDFSGLKLKIEDFVLLLQVLMIELEDKWEIM